MNTEIISRTARATLEGTILFPDVVKNLIDAGVEYYHADYVTLRKTFYGTDGAAVVTPRRRKCRRAIDIAVPLKTLAGLQV